MAWLCGVCGWVKILLTLLEQHTTHNTNPELI